MEKPAKILVVDDEVDLQALLRQRFRKQIRAEELQFQFALNGKEALEVLIQDPELFVVLTDINMPEMDGLTLLSKIQALDRHLEVVIITAYGDMENIRVAMNRGAFDFLTKPLDFQDLAVTIDKTIQQADTLLRGEEAHERAEELEETNQFVREAFGRYVSDDVVNRLLDSPEGLSLGGEKRDVTILMSDLRGFTPLVESTEPEVVVALLNRYFEAMFEVIAAYQGTITEIVGDGLFVMFGAPLDQENSARAALACAVAMQNAISDVNTENESEGLPRVQMGIGVHSGSVIVGNIGSTRRAKYGAVGRHVNLAARIESYTVGGQILASDGTVESAGDDIGIVASTDVELKGIQGDVRVHEVSGVGGEDGLSLSRQVNQLQPVETGVQVSFTGIDTETASQDGHSARLLALSEERCRLSSSKRPAPFSTVKMTWAQDDGAPLPGDVYGKVLPPPSDSDDLLVHFTSVPREVKAFITTLLGSSSSRASAVND